MMSMRAIRAQVLVEQRIFWRNLSTMFFTFVLPIVLLALAVFSGEGHDDLLAMIVALGVLSTGFQGVSMQLAMHRDQGVLKGLMATPLRPIELVVAKVLSVLVVVVIESCIVLVVGIVFTQAPLPQHAVELVALLVVGTATFTALGFAMASVIPSADAAPAIVNAAYLAMVLISAVLTQVDKLPDATHELARMLPMSSLITGVRDTWMGGGGVLQALIVLVVWGAVATAWTVRRFRWEPREALH